jgi:hypothetical protein
MTFKLNASLLFLLIWAWLLSPVQAQVELNVLKTYDLEDPPIDIAFSTSRNEIYVLNDKGQLLIYTTDGRLTEKIDVGKGYDRLQLIGNSNVLFLSSRKDKTIRVIQLEFVQDIDTSGSPFKGPEDAPVVIAVFSEFQ